MTETGDVKLQACHHGEYGPCKSIQVATCAVRVQKEGAPRVPPRKQGEHRLPILVAATTSEVFAETKTSTGCVKYRRTPRPFRRED